MNTFADHRLLCAECQADNEPGRSICWLCHAKLNPQDEIVIAELAEPPAASLEQTFFGVLIFASLVLIVLVGIGIYQDSPGMLVFYGLLITPPLLITLVHSLVRKAANKPVTFLQIFFTLMISSLVTISVAIVLAAIAIIATVLYFIQLCFGR